MLVRDARPQAPQLDTYSDLPLYNTKAVVRQTGVPAPTLRAWERRYGILAPRRGENDYRLYSERDIAIVTWLHERIASGLTISQAIALLRSLEPVRRRGRRGRASGPLGHETRESHETLEAAERGILIAASAASGSSYALEDVRATLLSQLVTLDEAAANRTIAQAFAIYTIEDVCLSLFTPVLARIGQMWQDGSVTVTVEHFASALIRGRLESLLHTAPVNEGSPLALVGCAPGELHEIGALMLALFLRRVGLRVVYLGQTIEPENLMATIETVRPACLLLSAAQRPQAETLTAIGQRLTALGQTQPAFYFGGQAFTTAPDLAPQIRGVYLEMDAPAAALEIKRRLTA